MRIRQPDARTPRRPLAAGRRQLDRERGPVDVDPAAVALDDRGDDRQPEARPGARRHPGRARTARTAAPLLAGSGPGPSSLTLSSAWPSAAGSATSTSPPARSVDERVLDQVLEHPPQRVLVALDARRVRPLPHAHPGRRAVMVARPSPARRARRARPATQLRCSGAARALEHEQVVDQPRQPRCVAPQIGEHLGVGAVTGGVLDVAEQRRDRRAQLVRGVGEEPALAGPRACSSEASIRFSTPVSCADLVGAPPACLGQAPCRDRAVRSISAGARGQPAQRPQPATRSARAARERRQQRRRRRRSARGRTPRWPIVSEMSVVSEATSTAPPAAGPPASAIGAAYRRNGRPPTADVLEPGPPGDSARARARPGAAAARRASASARGSGRGRRSPRPRSGGRRPGSRARPGRSAPPAPRPRAGRPPARAGATRVSSELAQLVADEHTAATPNSATAARIEPVAAATSRARSVRGIGFSHPRIAETPWMNLTCDRTRN